MTPEWQRSLMILTATVVTIVIIAVLYWARLIFIPIALAVFFAFVLGPVVAWLQRRGLGRILSVCITVGMVATVAIGVGAAVTRQISSLANTVPDRRHAIKAKLLSAKDWVAGDSDGRFAALIDDVSEVLGIRRSEPGAVVVKSEDPSWITQIQTYLDPATEFLGLGAFAAILTVFMLLRKEDLRNRLIRLLGGGKVTTTTKAFDDASQRISSYLLTQLILNTAFGTVIVLGLFVLGVQYALLWGLIATLMRYVPYVGTWIGLIPPTLFSFAMSEGWGQPIGVLVLFIGLELICNNVFEPLLYGKSMGLSEIAQLVAAAVWTFLWGPVGLILSGPLTVCLLVLGRHVRGFDFFVVLLGNEQALEPRVVFYQRLAARDQDEASIIALEEAKKVGPDAVFDTLLLPALCLARRDAIAGDLDTTAHRFVVNAVGEIAEEVAELQPEATDNQDARVRVLLCPAHDAAERVAAELLALTLNPHRWETHVASDDTLASELLARVADFRPQVVVIAALPPGGASHSRYLITRLRRQFPDVKIVVGRWGCDEEALSNTEHPLKHTNGVDPTLAATRKRLNELHPMLKPNAQFATSVHDEQAIGAPRA